MQEKYNARTDKKRIFAQSQKKSTQRGIHLGIEEKLK